jgi:hypothetical protein
MQRKTPIWAYALAIIGGAAAMWVFVGGTIVTPLFIGFAVYTGIFGYIFPATSWRWGLWTSGPFVLTMLVSVASYGGPRIVDVYVTAGVLLFAGSGGYLGGQLARRRKAVGA